MENWSTSTSLLGLIIMLVVIIGPLATLLFVTLLGGPKVGSPKPIGGKVKMVFLGTMLTLVVAAILFTAVLGGVMSLVVPG